MGRDKRAKRAERRERNGIPFEFQAPKEKPAEREGFRDALNFCLEKDRTKTVETLGINCTKAFRLATGADTPAPFQKKQVQVLALDLGWKPV